MSTIRKLGAEFNTMLEIYSFAIGGSGTFSISNTQSRSGSYSFRASNAANGDFFTHFEIDCPNLSELFCQICFWPYSVPGSTFLQLIKWINGANVLGGIKYQGDGKLAVYSGNFANLLGTSMGTLNSQTWNTIELHIKIADSPDGVVQLKINGILEVDFGGDSKPGTDTYITAFSIAPPQVSGSTNYSYYDDIIINDTTVENALMPNDSWINGQHIVLLKPSGAGTYTQLTPDTGSNYDRVNNLPPAIASGYVYPTGADQIDSYTMDDCPAGMGPISSVSPVYFGQVSGVVSYPNVKPFFRDGSASEYAGSNIAIPNSFGKFTTNFAVDPITNLPWTVARINAMEFGPKSAT